MLPILERIIYPCNFLLLFFLYFIFFIYLFIYYLLFLRIIPFAKSFIYHESIFLFSGEYSLRKERSGCRFFEVCLFTTGDLGCDISNRKRFQIRNTCLTIQELEDYITVLPFHQTNFNMKYVQLWETLYT